MDERISELLNMCKNEAFDVARAKELLSQVDVNTVFLNPRWDTTLLIEATLNTNLKMTELLLENGADPNQIVHDENPLWNLQYPVYNEAFHEENRKVSEEADEKNLRMAWLLLEYGADPCMVAEGENLFSWVLDAVFDDDPGHLLDYRSRFFILLIAYGGKNDYVTPKVIKPFDKSNMLQYEFIHVPVGNSYYLTGEIVDKDGTVVATV